MLHVEQKYVHIEKCPVCGDKDQEHYITCKDYTVSGEHFNIVSCKGCDFKFTSPRPVDSVIGDYYKSEDYVSHSNTKKGLINKLYHAVRTRTLRAKLALISSYVSRGTILDYGCGTGMFLKTCKEAGWNCYGLEPDSDAARIAAGQGLKVKSTKAALEGEKYDIITLWHVLEHITDLHETLEFFKQKLSDTGTLIIAVPNYSSWDAKHYKEHWAGYDVPRHIYHFNLDSITRLLKSFGFKLSDTKPMKFDSYYVSLLSEKYKTGSMNYIHAFFNGLRSNLNAGNSSGYSSVIYIFKKG